MAVKEMDYFGPLPQTSFNRDKLLQWLSQQTISAQRIITGSLQAGQEISSAGFISGSAGWRITGDGDAEFNQIIVRGDIASSNWDGADPADLSTGPDLTATQGFYLDASAGAAQFTGSVYFQPPPEGVAGQGTKFELGSTFFMRVYQDNPAVGEDSLWLGPETNGLDRIVFGPPAGTDYLKQLSVRANGFRIEGNGVVSRFSIASSADGGNISFKDLAGVEILRFDDAADDLWKFYKAVDLSGIAAGAASQRLIFGEGYSVYADNTGTGSSGDRLWFDAPADGQIAIGPRAGSDYLDELTLRAERINYKWKDGEGDIGTIILPKGLIYDFGFTSSNTATAGIGTTETTILSLSATVLANISVTIFAWGWARFDNGGDESWRRLRIHIGGASATNGPLAEIDQTTGSGGTGNTSAVSNHLHNSGTGYQFWDTSIGGHAAGATDLRGGHSHTGPSHTHALGNQWNSIFVSEVRSFTPTGTSVAIDLMGQTQSGTQVYDARALQYMVVIN